MDGAIPIGRLSQIPPGEGRAFEVAGLLLAVFHTRSGEVFACQAACPHRGGPLADGLTDQTHVVCPLHDRIYDLRTGEGVGNECAIRTYPLRLTQDGTILLLEPVQIDA